MAAKKELTEAVVVLPKEEQNALYVTSEFEEFTKQVDEWKKKASKLVVTKASETGKIKQAKEARLAVSKIRIAANKKREELKKEALTYGNLVQGTYNAIKEALDPLETHLKEQENFVKLKLAREIAAITLKRTEELEPYIGFYDTATELGGLSTDEFAAVIITSMNKKEAAEAKVKELETLKKQNEKLKETNEVLTESNEVLTRASREQRVFIAPEVAGFQVSSEQPMADVLLDILNGSIAVASNLSGSVKEIQIKVFTINQLVKLVKQVNDLKTRL